MSKSLVLKVVSPEMKSYGGFEWPGVGGKVTAPDWSPFPSCGKGLHGWLNGMGDIGCQSFTDQPGAIWLVLAVDTDKIIDLGRKVKFPEAEVLFTGSMIDAARFIAEETGFTGPIIGIHRTGGYGSTLTGGYGSTLTGGDYSTLTGGRSSTLTGGYGSTLTGGRSSTLTGGYGSTLTGGYGSTLTGGDYSTLAGGNCSTLTGGYSSTLTGGDCSTLTGGRSSTLTGGDCSTLTGGRSSTLTGGYGSTLTGGDYSTLTGGDYSTLTGGEGSVLQITYTDTRKRIATAYVGEDGIKPNVPYKLDENHNFVEVKDA